MPGIKDGAGALEAVAEAAAEHGTRFVMGGPLRIDPGIVEPFLASIARDFPDVLPRYQRLARFGTLPRHETDAIKIRVRAIRDRLGLADRTVPRPSPRPVQLGLPLVGAAR